MDTAEVLETIKADFPATNVAWLKTAQDAFLVNGVPTRREEGWKYSDLAERLGEIALAPEGAFSSFKAEVKPGIQITGNRWDGAVPDNWKAEGISVRYLNFESEEDAAICFDCEDPLVQWNIAAGAKGLVINVPKNCAPDFELRLNLALLPVIGHIPLRILIRAGAYSKFQVTVSRTGKDLATDAIFLNEVIAFDLEEGAAVNLERMEDFPAAGTCGSALLAKIAKSARFHAATAVLGGSFVRHNYWIRLTGPEADAALHTLSVPGNEEHFDNHIQIFHDAPHCTSDQQFKTIAGGNGKGIFSGTIQVAQIAQKTNAFQNSQGMVLGPEAKVYAMPRLIIYADDVKCSHGATTGQLDEDALFYLRARGITRSSAVSLLLASFCESFFEKVTVDAAREKWQELALRKLEAHAGK